MDVGDACPAGSGDGIEPRLPEIEDLISICRRLNELGAQYVVIGGFAIITSGMARTTGDVDLLIDTTAENEALVFKALEMLPDHAVTELDPGDVSKYTVVRVVDEVVIDLMQSACGIAYGDAIEDVIVRDIGGVLIPFASPRLLWKMKAPTRREKDAPDIFFLQSFFRQRGEQPPAI